MLLPILPVFVFHSLSRTVSHDPLPDWSYLPVPHPGRDSCVQYPRWNFAAAAASVAAAGTWVRQCVKY